MNEKCIKLFYFSSISAPDNVWNDAEWENKLLNSLTASFTDDTKPWLEAVNIEAIKLLGENQGNADANSNNIAVDERAMLFKLIALLSQYIDDASIVTSNITKILSPLSQRSLIDLKVRSVNITEYYAKFTRRSSVHHCIMCVLFLCRRVVVPLE